VHTVGLTGSPLVGWHKRIRGSLAGALQPGAGQRGLPRPAGRQQHPRRGHPREL